MKAAQKEQQESKNMRNVENWLALMSGSCTNRVDAKDNEQLRDSLGRDRLWTVPLALLKGPIGVLRAPTGWFLPWDLPCMTALRSCIAAGLWPMHVTQDKARLR